MRVEVINTGTELLLGNTINTHLGFLGETLFPLGIRIQRQVCIPDGDEIRVAMEEAIPRSDVILVTGGLGPTSDDITREIVAELFGMELAEDPAITEEIRAYMASRGRDMKPDNRRQAMVPRGAVVLHNPHGTAPGLYFPSDSAERPHVYLLPGPPRELRPMVKELVIPRLRELLGDTNPPKVRGLKFFGVGESEVSFHLEHKLAEIDDLEIGYCARPGEVDLRCIGSEAALDRAQEIATEILPRELFSTDGSTMEEVVVQSLIAKGQVIATAESCTGGFIANRITNVSGASSVLNRSFVTYANEAKAALLGVSEQDLSDHGAVSEPVARQMAEGCVRASGADHALAVTGIAGPTGGTDEKPVGTVFIGIASEEGGNHRAETLLPVREGDVQTNGIAAGARPRATATGVRGIA